MDNDAGALTERSAGSFLTLWSVTGRRPPSPVRRWPFLSGVTVPSAMHRRPSPRLSRTDGQLGDAFAAVVLEVEGEAYRAAGEVTGDVNGSVVAAVAGLDGVHGVGDERDAGPPGADAIDPVVLGALVLDGRCDGELGEVGVVVGLRSQVEVAANQWGCGCVRHGSSPRSGPVRLSGWRRR